MRTRQTKRKAITLPGQYSTGVGAPQNVTLTDLSVGGCRFKTGAYKPTVGTGLQIYVGESGPYRAVVKWIEKGEAGVSFLTPLTKEKFESFQSSHVVDAVAPKEAREFDPPTSSLPQRFC